MTDVIALSRAFVDHWNRRDIDAIVAALSEDVVYQNVPLPEMNGHAQVRAFITPNLRRVTRMHWVVHNLAVTADGTRVFTERTDSFHFGDRAVHVPVMGIFEFRDDLIRAWRDYADVGDFVMQMRAIGQRPGWDATKPA
jgi:limonene-1,2-epoxide hydrolase